MKRLLYISIWILLLSSLVVTLGFVSVEQGKITCKSMDINIDRTNDQNFLDENDIKAILIEKGNSLIGQEVSKMNLEAMENAIKNNPFVASAEVYRTLNGELRIEVTQRKPVLRVYNQMNESFYVDENGALMPLSEKFSSKVMVATGNIADRFGIKALINDTTLSEDSIAALPILNQLFILAKFIEKDETLQSLFVQAYVNDEKEIELTPRIGNHQVILGNAANLEDKFKKLLLVYSRGFNKTGWDQYTTVNLKFKNQVVCTRNDIKTEPEVKREIIKEKNLKH